MGGFVVGGFATGGVVVIGDEGSSELQLKRNPESITITICLKSGFIIFLN